MSPPWGMLTKAIVASAIVILTAIVVWRFQFLLTPLVVAGIIAYLVDPLVRWLRRKTGIRRSSAVLILYLVLFVVVGGVGFLLGLIAIDQTIRLWRLLPDLLPRVVEYVEARTEAFTAVEWSFGPYRLDFGMVGTLVDWDALTAGLREPLQTVARQSGVWLANLAQATVATIGQILLILVISIYLAIDAPRFGQAISDLAHQPGYRYDADRLMTSTIRIWNAYLRGQIILGLVIGVVVAVVLGLLGVSNALGLGVLSGVLEFLPVVGPVIGAATAVLVAFFQDSNPFGVAPWLYALIVLGAMFVIQQIENNLLVPRIVGDALDLHPIAVMVGVLMGASLAGLLGAVLAAPVVASLKLYGSYIWRKMLDLPPFVEPPPETQERPQESLWSNLTQILAGRSQQK